MGDETIKQKKEVLQGARALGSLGGKYLKKASDRLLSPLAPLSRTGRYIAGAAVIAVLVSLGLAVFDASTVDVEELKTAVVSSQKVNIRQSPSTRAAVVAQAVEGERFVVLESEEKWTKVRSREGETTGWIATSLIRTRASKTLVYRYDMKGYVLLLLGAAAVLVLAFRFRGDGRNPDHP